MTAHRAPAPCSDRTRILLRALLLASGICFTLLAARMALLGRAKWMFLVWNLALAWMPVIFARALCNALDRPGWHRWMLGPLAGGWLLFFPNAAYIVTDLVHLQVRPGVPMWFDVIVVAAYAITGLVLGYASLSVLHARVRSRCGGVLGWLFVGSTLALSSWGIYLGRFLRWNSWDPILRPWKPLRDLERLAQPERLAEAAGFCVSFFLLSLMVYLLLHALAHLHAPVAERDPAAR